MTRLLPIHVLGLLLVACGTTAGVSSGGSSGSSSSGGGSSSSGGGSSSSGSSEGGSSDSGVPPSVPHTVGDLVNLANSLPHPLTIAGFIAALPHPLALNATSSQFSAQPAVDANDPRIFIVIGNLVLSVVPTGPNVNNLEIGDMSNGRMSPAHITFPLTGALAPADPYKAVLDPNAGGASQTATACAKCHGKTGAEVEISQVAGTPVYAMGQIPPFPQLNVPATTIISLAQSCSRSSNPERCDVLTALTTPTTPTQYTFP
jgi:hypothetical protein